MTVRKIIFDREMIDISGTGYDPMGEFRQKGALIDPSNPLKMLLQTGLLASDAVFTKMWSTQWKIKGDPHQGALVVAAAKAGLYKEDLNELYPRIDEIPLQL